MKLLDVFDPDRGEPRFGSPDSRAVGVSLVQGGVERFFSELLIVVASQGGHDGVREKLPVALEVLGVEPGMEDQVGKDVVERLEVVSVDPTDDRR